MCKLGNTKNKLHKKGQEIITLSIRKQCQSRPVESEWGHVKGLMTET